MTDTTTPTAEMPIYNTRSFWAQIGMLVSAVLAFFGESALGAEFAENFPDAMLALISAAFGVWSYVERLYGKAKLVL